jgi:hypothetical protein
MKKILFILIIFLCAGAIQAQIQTSNCYQPDSNYRKDLGYGFIDQVNPSFSIDPVKKVMVSSNYVIVVGDFRNAYGDSIKHLAIYEKTSRKWYKLPDEINGPISCATIKNNILYIGGKFSKIGNTTINNFAKYDLVNKAWSAVSTSTNIAFINNGTVSITNLEVINNDVIFTISQPSLSNYLAFIATPTTITQLFKASHEIYRLKRQGDSLIFIGAFQNVTLSSTTTIQNIKNIGIYYNGVISQIGAGLNITQGSFSPGELHGIDIYNNTIYVTGAFDKFNSINYSGVLKYNGTQWDTATKSNILFSNYPRLEAIVVNSKGIYVADYSSGFNTGNGKFKKYANNQWGNLVGENQNSNANSGAGVDLVNDPQTDNIYGIAGNSIHLIETSKPQNIYYPLYHGIDAITNGIKSIKVIGDFAYFFYDQGGSFGSSSYRLKRYNLKTHLLDTSFNELRTLAGYSNLDVSAIQTNGNKLLVAYNAKLTNQFKWHCLIQEYNPVSNSYSSIGPNLYTHFNNGNETVWGCGFLRGKYFALRDTLMVLNGNTWIPVSNSEIDKFNLSTSRKYNSYDINKVDSCLYYASARNGQYLGIYRFDGTSTTPIIGGIYTAVHASKKGDVYFGASPYTFSAPTDNVKYYNIDSNAVLSLGGGVTFSNNTSTSFINAITSINDSIFLSADFFASYNGNNPAPAYYNSNVQVWNKQNQQWSCFDSRIGRANALESYNGGIIGSESATIAKNGLSNVRYIYSDDWWVYNGKGDTTFMLPAYIPTISSNINQVFEQKSNLIKLYPNPAKNTLYLDIINSKDKEYIYEIFDVLGKSILKGFTNEKEILVTNLKTGIYFLQVNNSFTSKFVKE